MGHHNTDTGSDFVAGSVSLSCGKLATSAEPIRVVNR